MSRNFDLTPVELPGSLVVLVAKVLEFQMMRFDPTPHALPHDLVLDLAKLQGSFQMRFDPTPVLPRQRLVLVANLSEFQVRFQDP
jgi:hypothetical protein